MANQGKRASMLAFWMIAVVASAVTCSASVTISPQDHKRLSQLNGEFGSYVVVFKGDWCPDCRKTRDVVETLRAKADANGVTLVEVDVGPANQYFNDDHFARADPFFKLRRIPTVYFVKDGRIAYKSEERQLFNMFGTPQVKSFFVQLAAAARASSAGANSNQQPTDTQPDI